MKLDVSNGMKHTIRSTDIQGTFKQRLASSYGKGEAKTLTAIANVPENGREHGTVLYSVFTHNVEIYNGPLLADAIKAYNEA